MSQLELEHVCSNWCVSISFSSIVLVGSKITSDTQMAFVLLNGTTRRALPANFPGDW